jgi:5-methyltetrahydrofolate--homocysteine methyltransferase
MAINLHFTDEDWERIERDWTAWWAHELERPMVVIEGLEMPAEGTLPVAHAFTANFPLEVPADEVIASYQAHLEVTRFYGDAWPRWWPNFGPGIVAGFLGAHVHPVPETVWYEPARQVNAASLIEDLHLAYDPDNAWWRRVRELTRTAVERWGNGVTVAYTDLGGNLDILASLRTTQQLLLDVCDSPDEVERLVGEITRLWLRYYDELDAIIQQAGRGTTAWAPIWSPGRCYMMQSDFSYMISPRMFERFVLPDMAACCEAMEHGFYHLDGKGEIPHLGMLLSLERLRGIQWVPGDGQPPAEEWLPLLKRMRDAGKLCQLAITPQGARTIVRELGGRGFAFHITWLMGQEEAEDLLRTLAAEDAGRRSKL